MKQTMLIIYGPTGVGKTDVALELAQQVSAEIVNIDIGQMYAPLTIGTAKVDWQNQAVPHHLFDIINEPCSITVTEYRALVLQALQDIWRRNRLPILVGGSGFYIKSLLFPPSNALPSGVQSQNKQSYSWDLLHEIDPARAEKIHPKDTYRIARALDIWYSTGTLPSLYQPQYSPPCPYGIVYLNRDRPELYDRIDARVHTMLHAGWLQEAQALCGTPWESFLREKKIIGYDTIYTYLDSQKSNLDYERMVHTIQRDTRHYAKRQGTFWRMLKELLAKQPPPPIFCKTINLSCISQANACIQIRTMIDNYQEPL